MKQGDIFIPYHIFEGKYIDVISELDILTRSEKRFLIVLNSYCYKNGKCYPSQATIGRMMGSKKYGGPGRDMSTRQVRNIQNALVEKGFLQVERSPLIARHLLRRSNRYRFLWHASYVPYISAEISEDISAEISGESPIIDINPQAHIQQNPAVADFSMDDFEESIRQEINTLTDTIAEMLPTGHRFNPSAFAGWAENKFPVYPLEVVKVSLESIRKRIVSSGSGGELWGYGVQVVQAQGPNLCAEAERRDAQSLGARLNELLNSLGKDTLGGAALRAVGRGSSL